MKNFENYDANYNDYYAQKFFSDYGLEKVNFERRDVTMGNGAKVALIRLSGTNSTNGHIINVDLWPARCQTLADLKAMPVKPEDIIIRFGTYTDETTGETVEASMPKVVAWCQGETVNKFSGNKPEWVDGGSVYNNEEPVQE